MDKVIDFKDRMDRRRQGRRVELYRGRIRALQQVLQCSSCHLKCAMCGHHMDQDSEATGPEPGHFGCVFCANCKGEFEDFLAVSRGEKQAEVFWQNRAWMDMWSAWLDYQQAIQRFRHSPEFKLLLSELEE